MYLHVLYSINHNESSKNYTSSKEKYITKYINNWIQSENNNTKPEPQYPFYTKMNQWSLKKFDYRIRTYKYQKKGKYQYT